MEEQATQTPIEDLRKAALEHYEKCGGFPNGWLSTIPTAINYYFDQQQKTDLEKFKELFDSVGIEYKEREINGCIYITTTVGDKNVFGLPDHETEWEFKDGFFSSQEINSF